MDEDLAEVPLGTLSMALAELHQRKPRVLECRVTFPVELSLGRLRELVHGAGFDLVQEPRASVARLRRLHTLPDYVRPGLRLLICGLNPSPYAAETGIPFGRPGNRFWPAALAAGLLSRDRDVAAALEAGIGFTDWVKRTTRRAQELRAGEFERGRARVHALVAHCRPRALCMVGLQGYRTLVDRRAQPGWTTQPIEGCPVYLMPSTSGLNAHSNLSALTEHLRCASRAAA